MSRHREDKSGPAQLVERGWRWVRIEAGPDEVAEQFHLCGGCTAAFRQWLDRMWDLTREGKEYEVILGVDEVGAETDNGGSL